MPDPLPDFFFVKVSLQIEVVPHLLVHVVGWLNAPIPFAQFYRKSWVTLDGNPWLRSFQSHHQLPPARDQREQPLTLDAESDDFRAELI